MSKAHQPKVDFLNSWAVVLPKSSSKSSLQLAIQIGNIKAYSKGKGGSSGWGASLKNVFALKAL